MNFFKWLRGSRSAETVDVVCSELLSASLDYQIRELSFWTCVNMVANALGRCEFRTFRRRNAGRSAADR